VRGLLIRFVVATGVVACVGLSAAPVGSAAPASTGKNGASCTVLPESVSGGASFYISGSGLPSDISVDFVATFSNGTSETATGTTNTSGITESPPMATPASGASGPAAAAITDPNKRGNQTLASCAFSVT
jgi:hypothetical protein